MKPLLLLCLAPLMVVALTVDSIEGLEPAQVPIEVGKAGNGKKDAKKLKKTTSATGKITDDYKNTSGASATDVHVEIISMVDKDSGVPLPPTDYNIGSIETWEIDDDTSHMTGSPAADGDSASAETAVGESLANGKQLKVSFKIVDKNGDGATDVEVEYKIYWTENDDVICATRTDEIGSGRPRALLAQIVPDYNPATAEVAEETQTAACNDICLAETDGYRFQDGDLVLAPDNSAKFAITANTRVLVYDEDGENASSEARINHLRIDDRGNFVFTVDRNPGHDRHVVLVIRGLTVIGLGHYDLDQEVHAGAGGSAISGYCLHDLYTLVRIVAAE